VKTKLGIEIYRRSVLESQNKLAALGVIGIRSAVAGRIETKSSFLVCPKSAVKKFRFRHSG
jgi:hypothetical protein